MPTSPTEGHFVVHQALHARHRRRLVDEVREASSRCGRTRPRAAPPSARSMSSNDSTEISPSWLFRISTKRDMCVPLKLCGRCTYMLKVAMVCCTPLLRSRTRTGWRIALMPTLSMARWRVSAELCTSGMTIFPESSWGYSLRSVTGRIIDPGPPPEHVAAGPPQRCRRAWTALENAFAVQAAQSQQQAVIAVFDEPIGQPQLQDIAFDARALQGLRAPRCPRRRRPRSPRRSRAARARPRARATRASSSGFTKRMLTTVASSGSAASSAGFTMEPKARMATRCPRRFTSPLPTGSAVISGTSATPGPPPRG